MNLDSHIDLGIYQLFIEEALKLSEQIETILPNLSPDSSPATIQTLVRSAHTIKGGAAQVNLTNIQSLASQLETSFRCLGKKNIEIDRDLVEQLEQAYQFLRLSLLNQIQTGNSNDDNTLTEAESIFTQLKTRLGKTPSFDEELFPKTNEIQENVKIIILNNEVAEALESLEGTLARSSDEELLPELQTQIAMFLDLGMMLEIAEFVSISQITLATLEANPEAVRNIGQLALVGFRAAKTAVVRDNPPQKVPPVKIERSTPTKVTNISRSPLVVDREKILDTSKLLVWHSAGNIFTLPYNRIAKNISSKLIKTIDSKGQKLIRWPQEDKERGNSQLLKIYSLAELLKYQYPHCNTPAISSQNNAKTSILIVNSKEIFLAVETKIERIITTSQLKIEPFNPILKAPKYIYGCTILKNNLPTPTIDLAALLSLTLERKGNNNLFESSKIDDRNSLTPSQKQNTTILIVDDSATWLYILENVLREDGYRIIKAKDGREGIDRLQQHPEIKLIISDLEMPNLNGFQFLDLTRQKLLLTKLPFILLTTRDTEQHRKLANQLGVTAYFTKPYNKSEFLAAIASILDFKT